MTKVMLVAKSVHPDEPAWMLTEMARGGRWIQRVWVNRADRLACYETDLGSAEAFKDVAGLVMPGMWEESVASLRYHADQHRLDSKMRDFAKRHRDKVREESTLIPDVLKQAEEQRSYIRNQSVFGPGVAKQRNIYDSTQARRKLRDKRKSYTGIIPKGGQ